MKSLILASLLVFSFNLMADAGDQAVAEATALTLTPTDSAVAESKVEIIKEPSIKNLKETEIPVNLDSVKKADASQGSIYKVIMTFAILGLLGCAGYFGFRKYAKMQPKNQANQIKILTQHYLGPKKSLAIIRVAGESVLIGITDQNITMIKSLSLLDEDIPEETPKNFNNVFNKVSGTGAQSAASAGDDSQDDFSISGIKDFVSSRLKNMRTLE